MNEKQNELEKRPIKGYEGFYSITSNGNVISEKRIVKRLRLGVMQEMHLKEKELKNKVNEDGYSYVTLHKETVRKDERVHRLVATAFLPPPLPDQTQVRHKEGDPSKNTKDDLEWGTPSDNTQDSIRHGTISRGEKHPRSKVTVEQVLEIRQNLTSVSDVAETAKKYGISYTQVNRIWKKESWSHVK